MKNTEPNRETDQQASSKTAPGEPSSSLQNRTLNVQDQTSNEVRETINRTQDCDLFATLKSGTANVETLKLLIPGFELLKELGRGAFGVVYRARDEKLDRHVAIKVSLIDEPHRREQYVKEARYAAKLDFPGIVPVLQVGTLSGGQPFVVQRLIEGVTLREALSKGGSIEVHHACRMMSEIARVVAKAHAEGMIHRDIKPDNILLDASGQPWVADFGLAILEEDQIEQTGERAGTPLYMSPEQLCGRMEWLDGRTDIYAMGVMLYEMIAGRTPFEARNLVELEEQVRHRDPKPISQRVPNIPTELDVIFRNCCAKKVEDRYANANALVDDLESLLADLPEKEFTSSPFVTLGHNVPLSTRQSGFSRGASHTASRIKSRRQTLRESSPLDGTLELRRAKPQWRKWAMPTVILLLASCLSGLLFLRPGKSTLLDQPIAEANLAEIIPLEVLDSNPPDSQQPTAPVRPFRVSKGSDATHHTIAAAIAAAEVGETITILPGTYVEALQIDRAICLVGEGRREDIVIVGENCSAIVVGLTGESKTVGGEDANSVVKLDNLTLEGIKTGEEEFNTIEVKHGSLTLTGCQVNSRSWDCIKLQPDSSLNAELCSFRSSTHPAISAKQASGLTVSDCNFDIHPLTLDSPLIPVGIQASNTAGLVQRCKFVGSGAAKGIHWKESSQRVLIEDASFLDCEMGIIAQACDDIHVSGSSRSQFSGCRNGLVLQGCTAVFDDCDIHSTDGKIGIRIVDAADLTQTAKVQLNNCSVSGFEVGLEIDHAHVSVQKLSCSESSKAGLRLIRQGNLHMVGSSISDSEEHGIYIQDAIADIVDCHFSGNGSAGVYLDNGLAISTFQQCMLKKNQVGLLIVAGSAKLEQCDFTSNSVGVLVATYEMLKIIPVAHMAPIALDIAGGYFSDNTEDNLRVLGPCRITISGWDGALLADIPTPTIIAELDSKQDGNEYQIFEKTAGRTE